MKSIGVIGTAKNTGKTTTLSFLIKGLLNRGINLAVTGIGYDGEEIDNITLLPKPKLYFEKNIIVATSENCLKNSQAEYELIAESSVQTPLGKVLVVRITKPGMIVLAGPNRLTAMNEVTEIIEKKAGCSILLVDGSLNRMSPMLNLDKLIFTTGASRTQEISKLVKEITIIERAFTFSITKYHRSIAKQKASVLMMESESGSKLKTIILEDNITEMNKVFCSILTKGVFLPNTISLSFLNELLNTRKQNNCEINIELILKTPINLLLSAEYELLKTLYELIESAKLELRYLYKPVFLAITINPFYPKLENYHFVPSYVDKDIFAEEMKRSIKSPIFNVKESESEQLIELCLT